MPGTESGTVGTASDTDMIPALTGLVGPTDKHFQSNGTGMVTGEVREALQKKGRYKRSVSSKVGVNIILVSRGRYENNR